MDLSNLFRNTENSEEFQAGATIFEQGSPGEVMYVVLEGEVEVWIGNKPVDIIRSGNILGEMALIDTGARSATAVAKSYCRLAPVDQRRFLYLVQQTPFFALEVMRVLADRLRLMNSGI